MGWTWSSISSMASAESPQPRASAARQGASGRHHRRGCWPMCVPRSGGLTAPRRFPIWFGFFKPGTKLLYIVYRRGTEEGLEW